MPTGNLYTSMVMQIPQGGMAELHFYLGTSFLQNGQSRVWYNLTATDDQNNNYTAIGYIWRGQLIVSGLTQTV